MDADDKNPDQGSLLIKSDDDVAKGRFANLAQVGSNQDAFVFDFAFVHGKTGYLLSRTLMSPQHAKRLSMALSETLAKYEARHGSIQTGPTLQ